MAELFGLRTCEADAHERALEVVTVARGPYRNEGTAARRRRGAELETKLGQDAAQFSRLALIAFLHLAQRRGLVPLDAIERSLPS